MSHKLTVMIDEGDAEFIKSCAKRDHRTVSGQVNYMIEIARKHIEEVNDVFSGKTQVNPELLGGRG